MPEVPDTTPATTDTEPVTTPDTDPVPPITGVGAFSSDFTITSDDSITLKLRAVCHAESKGDGKATVKVDLYLDYQKLYIGSREGTLTVGDKTVKFTVPEITSDDEGHHSMLISTVELQTQAGATITIKGVMPYNGTYSGKQIADIICSKDVILK